MASIGIVYIGHKCFLVICTRIIYAPCCSLIDMGNLMHVWSAQSFPAYWLKNMYIITYLLMLVQQPLFMLQNPSAMMVWRASTYAGIVCGRCLTLEVTNVNFHSAPNSKLINCISLKNHYITNNYPRNVNEISLFWWKLCTI